MRHAPIVEMSFDARPVSHVSPAFGDPWIGPEQTGEGVWSIWFDTVLLATLDE